MCKPETSSTGAGGDNPSRSEGKIETNTTPSLQDEQAKNRKKKKKKKSTTTESSACCNAHSNMAKNEASGRRGKRIKQDQLPIAHIAPQGGDEYVKTKKVKSGSCSRHEGESQSGGLDALLPSFIAVIIIGCGIIAKMGFRGRATVCGIDLGTTNSVICVQEQSKGSEGT